MERAHREDLLVLEKDLETPRGDVRALTKSLRSQGEAFKQRESRILELCVRAGRRTTITKMSTILVGMYAVAWVMLWAIGALAGVNSVIAGVASMLITGATGLTQFNKCPDMFFGEAVRNAWREGYMEAAVSYGVADLALRRRMRFIETRARQGRTDDIEAWQCLAVLPVAPMPHLRAKVRTSRDQRLSPQAGPAPCDRAGCGATAPRSACP
jgi:hypothetical protein